MPRIPRKNQAEESLTYHIYNRGNGKLKIFHDNNDFRYFLGLIKRYKQRYYFDIFHWVLMSNHFHFILTMEAPDFLSKCIGGILQAYAQYHHLKRDSAGRLWQGRFVSQTVEKERYLYECGRYIERNPMRAGIVRYPWEYQWSSCCVYVKNLKDNITTVDPVYESFGKNNDERARKYKEWLMEGEDSSFENMNHPVGDSAFIKKLLLKDGRMVIRKRGRPVKERKD